MWLDPAGLWVNNLTNYSCHNYPPTAWPFCCHYIQKTRLTEQVSDKKRWSNFEGGKGWSKCKQSPVISHLHTFRLYFSMALRGSSLIFSPSLFYIVCQKHKALGFVGYGSRISFVWFDLWQRSLPHKIDGFSLYPVWRLLILADQTKVNLLHSYNLNILHCFGVRKCF